MGNCTYLYAPAQGEKRKRLLAGAELAARETANRIAAREHVRAEHRNPLGIVLSKFTEKDEKPRSTSEFFALPTCISWPVRRPLPHQHHHDHRRRARWADGCTQCPPACTAARERHPVRCEDRASRRHVNPVLAKAPKRA
ncbi:MAG: hypothetical protein ACLSVD_09520 [Eggerthellaceae bacterium]